MITIRLFKKNESTPEYLDRYKSIRCHTENPELVSIRHDKSIEVFKVGRELQELPHGGILVRKY